MTLRDVFRPGFTIVEQQDGTAISTTLEAPPDDGVAVPEVVWIDADSVALAATELIRGDGNSRILMLHIPRDADWHPPETHNPAENETKWVFATSGTTGRPKLVAHTLESLTRTTLRTERPKDRWGLLYPWHRFAGLQVLLQTWLAGSVLISPDLSRSLADQLAFLAEAGCTHLSATPTMWRQILMSGALTDSDLRQVTLGGEIADQRTLDALRSGFPTARISHIFASTEAGVGFSVSDGREGFPVEYLDQAPNGAQLRVVEGVLEVFSPLAAERYFDSSARLSHDGWVPTGDMVEIREDRVLFLGRKSGLINIGGSKFFPEQIESVATNVDGVQLARVSIRQSRLVGSLVLLDIVVDAEGDSAEIARFVKMACVESLPTYMRPAKIRVINTIALNETGKVER